MKAQDKKNLFTMNPKIVYILLFILIGFVTVLSFFDLRKSSSKIIPYSEFLQYLDQGNIDNITVIDSTLTGEIKGSKEKDKTYFSTTLFDDPSLVQKLHEKKINFRKEIKSTVWENIFSWVLPVILFYFIWMFIARRFSGSAESSFLPLTKSKAKIYKESSVKTTFADVAGIDEAKAELREVVNFLKEPSHYVRLGGRMPKGILLLGPPGTGKTLLAKAVAGEASVPFFMINGSEFVEMFVGLGAARVRDLFDEARKSAPCILFIDEIDALGKSRASVGNISSNDEKEQTLNQLLAEIDGFDSKEGVILLAATNRPEILDPALLRSGRFDLQILIGLPDKLGREQILNVHLKKIKIDPEINSAHIAGLTPGFSGADLANLVNEAALIATRRNADCVSQSDFTEGIERIVAGLEHKKKIMNAEEKKRIAFHEMGHATVSLFYSTVDKVHKISIIPRGIGALGYTLQRPTEDRYLMDEDELLIKIAILLGGRTSEKIFFNKVSTGAVDDLVKASEIARAMVVQYGMSEKIGVASYDLNSSKFLNPQMTWGNNIKTSEETANMIDLEIKRILDAGLCLATKAIEINRLFLNSGAEYLLNYETIDEANILKLWGEKGRKFLDEKQVNLQNISLMNEFNKGVNNGLDF